MFNDYLVKISMVRPTIPQMPIKNDTSHFNQTSKIVQNLAWQLVLGRFYCFILKR